MEIQVTLNTSAFRGDHAADVAIAVNIDKSMTIKRLVDAVFEKGFAPDNLGNPTRVGDKFVDSITIRVSNPIK